VHFLTALKCCIRKIAPTVLSLLNHRCFCASVAQCLHISLPWLTALHAATNFNIALFAQSCAFLHQQCSTRELQKVCAGKTENVQAAKHIIEILRLAKTFDASRLCVVWEKGPSIQADLHPDGVRKVSRMALSRLQLACWCIVAALNIEPIFTACFHYL
jgi:hypothetical protein